MKKRISLLICLALIIVMTGCGNGGGASGKAGNQPAGVNDVLEQGMADADSGQNDPAGGTAKSGALNDPQSADKAAAGKPRPAPDTASRPDVSSDGIDVDLTALSSTMVYSEVSNMMTSPEKYIGKTVKMKGPFSLYHDEDSGKYYFACIIQDATACCAQGIEFVLTEDYTYPDDYPDVNEEICVIGVFDTYQEDGYTYCTLRNADLL